MSANNGDNDGGIRVKSVKNKARTHQLGYINASS